MANYYRMAIFNLVVLVCFLAYSGGISSISTASAKSDTNVLVAKELQIVDRTGKVRCGIKYDVNNDPVLFFTDDQGELKSYLCVTENRPLLVFKDNNKIDKLMLFMSKKGKPGIFIKNDNSKISMAFGYADNENCLASFFDSNGRSRLIFGLSKNQPRIGMFDNNDHFRVMFGMNPDNSSVLAFLDENAYPALAMGHLLGTPMFRLQRPDKTGIFASYAPDNNVILSMQKEGRFTWSVPEIPRGGRAGDDPLNGIDWDNMIKGWSK